MKSLSVNTENYSAKIEILRMARQKLALDAIDVFCAEINNRKLSSRNFVLTMAKCLLKCRWSTVVWVHFAYDADF